MSMTITYNSTVHICKFSYINYVVLDMYSMKINETEMFSLCMLTHMSIIRGVIVLIASCVRDKIL